MIDHYLKNAILRAVARETGISAEIMQGRSRKREVSMARYLAVSAAWFSGMSTAATARMLDKDHTTILHGHRRAEEMGLHALGLRLANEAEDYARLMRAAAHGPYVNDSKTKRAIKTLAPAWNGEAA